MDNNQRPVDPTNPTATNPIGIAQGTQVPADQAMAAGVDQGMGIEQPNLGQDAIAATSALDLNSDPLVMPTPSLAPDALGMPAADNNAVMQTPSEDANLATGAVAPAEDINVDTSLPADISMDAMSAPMGEVSAPTPDVLTPAPTPNELGTSDVDGNNNSGMGGQGSSM